MAREFWQTTHKPNVITRNNNKIVIPAFSANCGPVHNCLHRIGFVDAGIVWFGSELPATLNIHDAITCEAWIKPDSYYAQGGILSYSQVLSGSVTKYNMYILNGFLVVTLNLQVEGIVTLTSTIQLTPGQWNHVAFTYDKTLLKLYINGSLNTSAAHTHQISPGTGDYFIVGDLADFEGSFPLYAYISEIRIWNVALTLDQMLYKYNKPRSRGIANVDDGLVFYAKVHEGAGTNITDSISLKQANAAASEFEWSTKYPPIVFGSSFIAAKFAFTAGLSTEKLSLKFPLKAPNDINFGLAVSWHDDDTDEFHRRMLWVPDTEIGVLDIAPYPAMYLGERLPTTFDFEVWNIDGQATVELEDDFTIRLSTTRRPDNSTDISETSLATLSEDSTLASDFPLTNTSVYNTQQTYT